MKKYLTLVLLLIALSSCDIVDPCGGRIYETGPPILFVEFVDKDSGENVFTNSTYQASDIQVVNESNELISFDFIDKNDYNIIMLRPYNYEAPNTIFIKIGETIDAKIIFDVDEHSSECSTTFFIENRHVENYTYEFSAQSEILKIKV